MKAQSLPLELTIITIGSIILITGSITAFDAITSSYDNAVQEYHMQKALTDTTTAIYHLNSLDQDNARITYQTPNREKQEQKYRITSSDTEIITQTNNREKTKNISLIADRIQGDSEQRDTSITKSGDIMVITGE